MHKALNRITVSITLLCASVMYAAQKNPQSPVPKPTMAEVRYGEHERRVLDLWKADSATPTPLVFGAKKNLD